MRNWIPWPPYPNPIAIFIVIVIVLIILGIYGCAVDNDGAAYGAIDLPEIPHSKYDEQMLELERQALDDAYKAQMKLLFGVWMKDPGFGPRHAQTGASYTRKAYIDVRDAFEKRTKK